MLLLVASSAIGRLELVQLGVSLGGEFSLLGFAVEIGSRAIVQGGMEIDPNLGIGIALIFRRRGGCCQA